MIKKRKQTRMAWAMAVMMLFSAFFPLNVALAATPASLDADVSVTGIADGGTIDGSSDVEVTVSFPVPVIGDGGIDYFVYGDVVTMLLSRSFKFDPVPSGSIDLMDGSKKLGTVTLSNNASGQAVATITFDGDEDVFDPDEVPDGGPPYSGVSGEFKANLTYNGTHDTDEEGNKTVSILEKTYKLQFPGDIITYTVEKSGDVALDAGTIEWTVTITATSDTDPVTNIDLKDYVFEDNLANVGKYVDGSFSLSGGTLVVPDSAAAPPITKLTYTFPAGSTSPQTLTFKTRIPDSVLTAGGDITNVADLYLADEKVNFDDFKVTVTKPAATKTYETNDDSSGTTYDPTGRTVTWYIEVDNKGRTLNDLIVTDELKGGLIFDSAQWQQWNAAESRWEDVFGINWTAAPTGNQYKVGEKINGGVDYAGRLKIVTKVPDSADDSVIATTYYNQASVSWSGVGGTTGSAVTENIGVGIGYDAISKSGAQSTDDVTSHQITWTINADMKGQDATGFKVFDLFVHDAGTSNADLTGATGWPSGISIGDDNITRNNGQKFVTVDGTNTDSHLTVTPIELKKDGKVIATLVEVTDLRNNGSNKAVLKSQVLDPAILAGNDQDQKVYNTAALYKGTTFRGQDNAFVNYNNKVLAKELLNRAEVGNDHAAGVDSINADNRTINVADGFHYGYKEVIFRLNVNAAGLDFANAETNLTEGFGDVVVTDTLPAGWEFAQFSDGQNYLIYNTTGALSTGSGYPVTGSLTTSGAALGSVSGLTADFATTGDPRTATFTFTDLDQPYVILVKARPAGDTFDGYLESANTRNETNTLGLHTENWKSGISVDRGVRVDSTVLAKTLDLSKQNQGILTWTVKYTPFGREIGTGLEDTLPQGIDLRTDSSGQLIWEQDGSRNINVHELTLKSDGSGEYIQGTQLPLDALQSRISYDNSARKLTFTFPDKTKAYQMTYVTDITGMPGLVSNAVKLVDADGTGTSTDHSFTITEQQGAATMGRSGYLVVKKTDISNAPLQNAEFTLYNTNADGSKGSARAVRATGGDGTVKFYGLAPGQYILVETRAPDDAVYDNPSLEYSVIVGADLKTTVNGSGVIASDNPFVVVNYREADQVGSLTISKAVAGTGADTTKSFNFTLTLDGAPGSYTYIGRAVPGGTIKSGDTVSLAHGQSITIVGLPNGTTYAVTETDYSGDGYTTTSTGATGGIVTNTTQAASFTNTRNVSHTSPDTGNLTISKTVVGIGADTAKKFNFTITFNGASGSYHYTGNGVPNGTIKSGDTISLAHGQSITITGLPVGATYQVSEEDASAQGYSAQSAGSSGTISSSRDRTATFTNTKLPTSTGGLTIRKTVTGHGADPTRKFDFTVTFSGASNAYPYVGTSTGTICSGDTLSLAGGESITITGLPEGTQYTVTEADYTEAGYTATNTGSVGTISAGALQTASFINSHGNPPDNSGEPGNPDDDSIAIGDGGTPTGSIDGEKAGMPQTGDNQAGSLAKLGLLFFSVALMALTAADFVLRKKYSIQRNRK